MYIAQTLVLWAIFLIMQDFRSSSAGNGFRLKVMTEMQMNNNFQEKESPTDQMPNVEINITGDVSVIKRDRVNYTDEEKKKYARQYGLTQKQVQELVQQPDGSWEIPSDNAEPNPDLNPDIFVANEE